MADERSLIKNLIKSAVIEVNDRVKSFKVTGIEEKKFLETLPDDCTYYVQNLSGVPSKLKACFMTEDITEENLEDWIAEYETLNNVSLKIKTKKKPTSGYVVQNYYRCQHNTRRWSPSKDPQRKLLLNPSARVKNTNCPFQMIIKIEQNGCCTNDIEWEHNHSLGTLEATNFRNISPECIEKVYKLYESGLTPSTARQEYLKDLKEECKDDLAFHTKKADRSVMPRRRDFNYIYTQFALEKFGGKGSAMFPKLVKKLQEYKEENPESTTRHQIYDGDDIPLVIAIVSPLMKRVHKKVPQSGELVFIDATSNTEEHNLKVFIMCTHSVAGALPCGILITSDEKESTLKQGFEMLKSCLPGYAFYGRGPTLGPKVILTDNCTEERNTLSVVWPKSVLLLCIFHILQQIWRWLHDKNHNITLADRPHLLSLFKKSLYAESEELFEETFNELLNDDNCKCYANLVQYFTQLYEEKQAFALCFRAELPVRGNHTNNFVESQFLVLKDTILRRVKEYNVIGLVDKLTVELQDHYKDKLLSIADGSFDGQYRRRFMGKGKDGGTGFKVPNANELDIYLSSIEKFDNNVFKVGSLSQSNLR